MRPKLQIHRIRPSTSIKMDGQVCKFDLATVFFSFTALYFYQLFYMAFIMGLFKKWSFANKIPAKILKLHCKIKVNHLSH